MNKSKWYKDTIGKVDRLLTKLNPGTIRKYKVDSIKRVILRVEEFTHQNCNECENHKQSIDQLLAISEDMSKGKLIDPKEYKVIYKKVLRHLKKDHGLVEERQYINQWIILGLIIGLAFTFLHIYAVSFGLILGIGIGALLEADTKKKGKQL